MRSAAIVLCAILILFSFSQVQATIIHVPGDSSTIQGGIDLAVAGDTVLVASGHYFERIDFEGKAILVASNFIFDQDTATISSTIIDADTTVLGVSDTGSVVCFVSGEDTNSVITGFTIQNGTGSGSPGSMNGGGIHCLGSSPTIIHNIVKHNRAKHRGGGIWCRHSQARILFNIIRANFAVGAGGGICDTSDLPGNSSCYIVGNIISENETIGDQGQGSSGGGGIACKFSSSRIMGNTIVRNIARTDVHWDIGGGILNDYGSPSVIVNNIIADNGNWGIADLEGGSSIGYNDVWSNTEGNIYGGPPGVGDTAWGVNINSTPCDSFYNIIANPLFCDTSLGDYYVSGLSPCLGAGEGGADIGALGIGCDFPPRTWFVSTTGNDTTGEGSEGNPFRTIQKGINVSGESDTILVLPGLYIENLHLAGENIILASSFLFSEDTSHVLSTIIDGDSSNSVITLTSGEDSTTQIVGFTIQNGYAERGGGIHSDHSSPTIRGNRVIGNFATYAGGVYCAHSGARILSNVIAGNIATYRCGGIQILYGSNALVSSNLISGNEGTNQAGGIDCVDSDPLIVENVITGNSCYNGGGIVIVAYSTATVTNNLIHANTARGYGGGLVCDLSDPLMGNNTITGNTALEGGGAVSCNDSDPTIVNTILWGNSAPTAPEILLWGSSVPAVSYCNVEGSWEGEGNIDADPLFCDTASGDYRISWLSPCAGAGQGGVDIGALGVGCDIPRTWHVSTSGDDNTGDGSEGNPFGTIQRGISVSSDYDTVLVVPGTYEEHINFMGKAIAVKSEVGPANTIITRVVDGLPLVQLTQGEDSNSVIDGFTIREAHAPGDLNGAILCNNSGPTIRNNILIQNVGRGIRLSYSGGAIITNNAIIGSGRQDVGIRSWGYNTARIDGNLIVNYSIGIETNDREVATNNTICNNSWNVLANGQPILKNNIIANADVGIHLQGGTPTISYNDVWGNTINYFGCLPGEGCVSLDPIFCNPDDTNYHLWIYSPCLGAGEGGANMGAFGVGCSTVGDANGDGEVNIGDVVYLVGYLYKSGPAPSPAPAGDVNCDDLINVGDVVYLVNYLFKGGPPPCEA